METNSLVGITRIKSTIFDKKKVFPHVPHVRKSSLTSGKMFSSALSWIGCISLLSSMITSLSITLDVSSQGSSISSIEFKNSADMYETITLTTL